MIDRNIKDIPVVMRRYSLENAPDLPLPAGYHFEFYKDGYEELWAATAVRAGFFSNCDTALETFRKYFPETSRLYDRSLFVLGPDGSCAGIATAWFTKNGEPLVHWVAVSPEHRRKGIAKALVSRVIRIFFEKQGPCVIELHTGTPNHIAVKLYRQLGFEAAMGVYPTDPEAWYLINKANSEE